MKKKILNMAITGLSTIALLSACGGGGGDSASGTGGTSGGTVSGSAAKGLIQNGIVTLKNGAGQVLQTRQSPVRTANDGSFTAVLSTNYTGPVFVEITADANTRIIDELTGQAEIAPVSTTPLLESVSTITGGGAVSINATPLTSIVAQLAKQAAQDASQDVNALLVQKAQLAITTTLGFNPIDTRPVDPRAASSADENAAVKKQAVLLAALAKFGQDNPTCAAETTRGQQLACAASQFKSAYVGSTISGEQATISIDGTKLTGFTQAVSDVSADPDINKTGTNINPATDDSLNEIGNAETNGSFEGNVEAPDEGFSVSDVAAAKELINSLRSNAFALTNAQANDDLQTEITQFADSITTQATGLEGSSFLIAEASAYGIELYSDYVAAANAGETRAVNYTEDDVYQCTVLSGVSRTDGVVTAITPANTSGINNAQFVGCVVFNDQVTNPTAANISEFRSYVLLTPTQGTTTFNVESDSRLCVTSLNNTDPADKCLDLTQGQVVDAVAASAGTLAYSQLAFGSGGSFTAINVDFDGQVAVPFSIAYDNGTAVAVKNADTVDLDLALTASFPTDSEIENFSSSGSITTTKDGKQLVATLNEFTAQGNENVETGEQSGNFAGQVTLETAEGSFSGRITIDLDQDVSSFTGTFAIKDAQGASTTLFDGGITLSSDVSNQDPIVFSSVMFNGAISLPNRPALNLQMTVSNFIGTIDEALGGSVNIVYQQAGNTVIVSGERTADGDLIEISSPSSGVSIDPFNPDPNVTTVVAVKRGETRVANYFVQTNRLEYVDGSFEQF